MSVLFVKMVSRDQDHCRALQSVSFGELSRADRHYVGFRSRFGAFLPDGRAAAAGPSPEGPAAPSIPLMDPSVKSDGHGGSLDRGASIFEDPKLAHPCDFDAMTSSLSVQATASAIVLLETRIF
jgi:hypothetical protein